MHERKYILFSSENGLIIHSYPANLSQGSNVLSGEGNLIVCVFFPCVFTYCAWLSMTESKTAQPWWQHNLTCYPIIRHTPSIELYKALKSEEY